MQSKRRTTQRKTKRSTNPLLSFLWEHCAPCWFCLLFDFICNDDCLQMIREAEKEVQRSGETDEWIRSSCGGMMRWTHRNRAQSCHTLLCFRYIKLYWIHLGWDRVQLRHNLDLKVFEIKTKYMFTFTDQLISIILIVALDILNRNQFRISALRLQLLRDFDGKRYSIYLPKVEQIPHGKWQINLISVSNCSKCVAVASVRVSAFSPLIRLFITQ